MRYLDILHLPLKYLQAYFEFFFQKILHKSFYMLVFDIQLLPYQTLNSTNRIIQLLEILALVDV